MEKRPPNEKGTGRHRFSYIEDIQVIFIPRKGLSEPNQQIKETICNYLQTYLRILCQPKNDLKMEIHPNSIIMNKKTHRYYVINYL